MTNMVDVSNLEQYNKVIRHKKTCNIVRRYSWVIFLAILPFYPASAQSSLKNIIKKVQPSTVMLVTYESFDFSKNTLVGKITSVGSGFFIGKNRIVTNRHVFKGGFVAKAKLANGEECFIGKVIAEDKEHDLVCVEIIDTHKTPMDIKPLEIDTTLPEVGDRIIVLGSPLGLEATVSEGIVSSVRKLPQDGEIIQITAPVSPGSSGSPLLNMKGKVIGVVFAQLKEGQNLNFAIPSKYIAQLKYNKGLPFHEWYLTKIDEDLDREKAIDLLIDNSLWFGLGNKEFAVKMLKKAEKMYNVYRDYHTDP